MDNNLQNYITEYFTNLNIDKYIFFDNFKTIKIELNTKDLITNIINNKGNIFEFLVNYITRKNIIPGLSVENIKLYDIDTETIINNYEDIKSDNIKSEKHIKIIIIPIKYDNI